VQVGDLVRYKYRTQDIGIIIETMCHGAAMHGERSLKHKVVWLAVPHAWVHGYLWVGPAGLELLSESR